MEEQVLAILQDVRDDGGLEAEETSIGDGILGSFDTIAIVSELDDGPGMGISAAGPEPGNLRALDALAAPVESL